MFLRNKHSQAAPNRTTLETWRNDETRAEYMARSGREGIRQQVPFLLSCFFLAAWLASLIIAAIDHSMK